MIVFGIIGSISLFIVYIMFGWYIILTAERSGLSVKNRYLRFLFRLFILLLWPVFIIIIAFVALFAD